MSKNQRNKESGPRRQSMTDATLATYIILGRRLAAQMAEANFRSIAVEPGWTVEQVQTAAEHVIARLDIGVHDKLSEMDADNGGKHWQAIMRAMKTAYRETTATILRDTNFEEGNALS